MRGLDASPVSPLEENVELHRPGHQAADTEHAHDIERRQDRCDSFNHATPAVPHLIPCALDDRKMQIDIRIRVRGTVGETSFKPSRREARISRENRYRAIDHLAAALRERNLHAHAR
jgi:hypothetical protein